ncbi:Hexose transporter 2 [Fulvia fulva]|uniref:Hexose transporter 2 n=1 Tax=Passalora fulva TaxID=5499 RepID=A0A9Q8PGJ5_PASFU|nr:Hexose transporter 2 [Fulvia fulva]UJO22214.1 Hexose transporter 2 [Fulvia fulva]
MTKHGRYVLCIGFFAALGTFFYGYDTGVTATTIGHASFIQYMNNPSHELIGSIGAAYTAGQAIGSLLQIAIGDRLGRIRFMTLLTTLVTIGSIIQTASTSIGMFVGGRALAGLGMGGMTLTVALYLSEIAPAHSRGLIGGLSGTGLLLGIVISYWTGYACSQAPYGQLQWRLPVALQIPWSVLFLCGLLTFMPETPRQLVKMGQIDRARAVFARLHQGRHEDDNEADHEFKLMHAQISFEISREITNIKEIFRLHYKRAIVAMTIGIATATAGAEVIGYFQVVLYASLGIDANTRLILVAVNGTIGFISVALSNRFLMDRWGRRNLLLAGMGGSILIQTYCAIMQWNFQDSDNEVGKGFAIFGIYLHTICHSAAFAGAASLYGAEVLPIALRSKMMGVAGFAHFSVAVGLIEAAPRALATIRQNYYYVFVGCTLCFLIFGYYYYPETKNKTLEEIAAAFGDKVVDVGEYQGGMEHVLVAEHLPAEKIGSVDGGDVEVKPQRESKRWSNSKRWSRQQIIGLGSGM